MSRTILETARLQLQELDQGDRAFVLELLTDADFLRHIGDRGVHSLDQAATYIADVPQASYARHGHGLWKAVRRDTGEVAGMCGLIRRDTLEAPDLGYAWLPRHRGAGFALEAADAVLWHGFAALRMPRILAIVTEANQPSRRLLERIGMQCEGTRDFDGTPLLVYGRDAA